MDDSQRQASEAVSKGPDDRTAEDVQAAIERTRAELGETVEALAAKADVKGQAKRAVSDARSTVSEKAAETVQAVSAKREQAVSAAQGATPDSAGEAGRRLSRLAQENRQALMPAAALLLGVLIGRRRTR
jgi:hypothetical protein